MKEIIMKIAGFQKTSFVDFPKMVSCVVFTPGCNMRCSYCHNKHILSGNIPKVDQFTVLDYLKKRVGVIGGVVVSGGEPTLQSGLENFVTVVKNMGYKIKLDTNGTNPNVLKSLCEKGLVDYVAMDLKAPFEKYSEICCAEINTDKIRESIEYLQKSGISHEFRTTFCPELTKEDVVLISENMAKNSEFYLQQYRQVDGGNEPHSREYVELTAELVRQNGGKCTVRGL